MRKSFTLSLLFALASNPSHAVDCYDCGVSGWEKMSISCSNSINSKESFKDCLARFPWSGVKAETGVEEFHEGYIRLQETITHETSVKNSIKVFTYRQWAVDKNGQLYLLAQLG